MTRDDVTATFTPGAEAAGLASSVDDPRVICATEEYAALLRAGKKPDRAAFLARHADIADALAPCLDGLEFVHAAGGDISRADDATAAGGDLLAAGLPLGDFQLLRELGRGGMGIVYEAEQLSLGRRVALKVLPFASTMDAKQLQRFKNEARAAASLHHEHIVPVYGVGCDRGVHYYAMQLIDGTTLAAIIGEPRPDHLQSRTRQRRKSEDDAAAQPPVADASGSVTTPVAALSTELSGPNNSRFYRTVARVIADAADALEHAHALGIVHRDVKPGNLIVDNAGKVWVTDFGLARFGPDAGLTMSGDLLGTLRYMAPEQVLARHGLVDHRADVYGLGCTLYELLTGRPAVDAADRAEVLRRIAFEEVLAPRKLARAVPVDLETITLKALAKNPNERFATAGDLSADLRRFVADQPIRARRPTARQRLARWGRRHPWVTAALALAAGVILAGAWAGHRHVAFADAAARASAAEAADLQERGRYAEVIAVAQRAIALLPQFGGDAALRREVEERAADLRLLNQLEHARLMNGLRDQARLQNGLAALGPSEEAAALYHLAFCDYGVDVLALDEAAAAAALRPRAVRVEIVAGLDEWSRRTPDKDLQGRLDRLADAIDSDQTGMAARLRRAERARDAEALKSLAAEADGQSVPRATLYRLIVALRSVASREPQELEATERFARAAVRRHPDDFWLNYGLAHLLRVHGPAAAAEVLRHSSVAAALRPNEATVQMDLGDALWRSGRTAEAHEANRRAAELTPNHYVVHARQGEAAARAGRYEELVVAYRRAATLLPDPPLTIQQLSSLSGIYSRLGRSLAKMGRHAEAATAYRRALEMDPLEGCHEVLGHSLIALKKYDEATAAFRQDLDRAALMAQGGIHREPSVGPDGKPRYVTYVIRTRPFDKRGLGRPYFNLGVSLRGEQRFAESFLAFRRAQACEQPLSRFEAEIARELPVAEQLFEARLSAVLAGAARPIDAADQAALAVLCLEVKKLTAASSRLFEGTFASDPKLADDMREQHRYNAACAAALAGCGQGGDAAALDDAERTRLRRQALDWLTADLAVWAKIAENPDDRPRLPKTMRHWQNDPDLAGVRDAAALTKLPGAERADWEKLWAGVAELLHRMDAPNAAEWAPLQP